LGQALALTEDEISSDRLAALLSECEAAIASADARASTLKEAMFDPQQYPGDARTARDEMENCVFMSARLLTLKGRLQQKYQAALDTEQRAEYNSDLEALRPKHDAVVRRFMRLDALIGEIVEIFQAAQDMDAAASAIHGRAPPGESARLGKVEAVCRGGKLSLLRATTLVDFASGRELWPPRQSMAAMIAPTMDSRKHQYDCGPEWWRAGAIQAEQQAKQEAAELAASEQAKKDFYGMK
jgi:hypothetical protein